MKRWIIRLLVLLLVHLPGAIALAEATGPEGGTYVEGIEYQRITPAQPTRAPEGKVEVVELFWYGCPHCYRFEPHLQRWMENKPAHVSFLRIPAQLNPSWRLHAAAFYTAEILDVTEAVHRPIFDAIHKERRRLRTPEALANLFERHGVDRQQFLRTLDSFAVRAKLAHARKLVKGYGAHSVPTIIVNGKYRTDAEMAGGSFRKLLGVVDYLVRKEARAAE